MPLAPSHRLSICLELLLQLLRCLMAVRGNGSCITVAKGRASGKLCPSSWSASPMARASPPKRRPIFHLLGDLHKLLHGAQLHLRVAVLDAAQAARLHLKQLFREVARAPCPRLQGHPSASAAARPPKNPLSRQAAHAWNECRERSCYDFVDPK